MRDFVLLFSGSEGSSALISTLGRFSGLQVLGFEPFDRHVSRNGEVTPAIAGLDLYRCLGLIFGRRQNPANAGQLFHQVYARHRSVPLPDLQVRKSIGFKLRHTRGNILACLPSLRRHRVCVFLLERQDLLAWAFSRMRGSGLQFDVAYRGLDPTSLKPVVIDPKILKRHLWKCLWLKICKITVAGVLRFAGVECHRLNYEDMLQDRRAFFTRVVRTLDPEINSAEIDQALAKDIPFTKVHKDNLATYVTNYAEVQEIYESFLFWCGRLLPSLARLTA